MRKLLLAWLFLLLANQLVLAQSTPGLAPGQVPTAAQWNSYFAAKQDFLGAVPLSTLGGTMFGRLNTFASSASGAGLNIPPGTAPSSPVNGDVWTTTSGLFAQINGTTIGPYISNSGGGGTLAVASGGTGQVSFTANLPLIGNGAGAIAQGTRSGNTTEFATFTGAATNGNCVSIDASGNLKADGSPCGAVGSVIPPANGGTGVNNGISTITIGGNVTFSGAFPFTATLTASTSPTFPAGTYTLANQTGTSGGIPYYSSATSQASSGVLGANLPVFGGGAGSAPIAGTRSGSTTEVVTTTGAQTNGNCVSIDASGNHIDNGSPCGSAPVLLSTLTCTSTTVCTDVGAGNGGTCGSSGCFTNTYTSFKVDFINFVATTPSNTTICQIQIYESGTFQTTGYVNFSGATTYLLCFPNGNGGATGSAPGVNGSFTIYNPGASAKAMVLGLFASPITNSSTVSTAANGYWNTNGAVTGFRAFWGTVAGTPTTTGVASGTIKIYGIP